jgi:hypothetical protein
VYGGVLVAAAVTAPSDVPEQVWAELERARTVLDPTGPPPSGAELADWWTATADAHDTRADAYDRLYGWARDTHQPPAVAMAVHVAVEHCRQRAWEARHAAKQVTR